MPAVAAEKPRVCCPKGAPVSNHHQLHLTLVNVDQHSGASLCVHEEDDSKDGHLELRAGPNESTANRLHQAMPAKLEVEHVVILIRLWIKHKTVSEVCKCLGWDCLQLHCVLWFSRGNIFFYWFYQPRVTSPLNSSFVFV